MKKLIIDKINILTINYLSVVGISDDKDDMMQDNNPILIYFYKNIIDKMPNSKIGGKIGGINGLGVMISDNHDDIIENLSNTQILTMEDFENEPIKNIKVSRILFYNIIKESYRVYKKLNEIINNQNIIFRQNLIDLVGGEDKYKLFIDNISDQYKFSLYDLVLSYNGKDKELKNIKINLLEEKMFEYVNDEEYLLANKIKNKIIKIKGD